MKFCFSQVALTPLSESLSIYFYPPYWLQSHFWMNFFFGFSKHHFNQNYTWQCFLNTMFLSVRCSFPAIPGTRGCWQRCGLTMQMLSTTDHASFSVQSLHLHYDNSLTLSTKDKTKWTYSKEYLFFFLIFFLFCFNLRLHPSLFGSSCHSNASPAFSFTCSLQIACAVLTSRDSC